MSDSTALQKAREYRESATHYQDVFRTIASLLPYYVSITSANCQRFRFRQMFVQLWRGMAVDGMQSVTLLRSLFVLRDMIGWFNLLSCGI